MVDPRIRVLLNSDSDESDEDFLAKWKAVATRVCKPCWEIKYCPYGPFVEKLPLLPLTSEEAEAEYTKVCTGDFVEEIPKEIFDLACNIFGHICPVFFVSEDITETAEPRRRGRYISFQDKMRIIRRDNYTCQVCGKHLPDNEVEFDHIIPLSKGGSSEVSNIRLTCFKCNRDKSNRIQI